MDKLRVLLVGIGGYGRIFYEEVIHRDDSLICVGVVQHSMGKHPQKYEELKRLGIPVFHDIKDFFACGGKADLAIIATPPGLHYWQCLTALQNGTHVLCEKPVSVGLENALEIEALSREKQLVLGVGYQSSYQEAILRLKADITQGRFGQAKSMKTLFLEGRSTAYYTRNEWAGKQYDPYGNLVYDGIANNSGAHWLHLMLYLSGGGFDLSSSPETVECASAMVNSIETYDLVALRVQTRRCPSVMFCGSHAYAGKPLIAYRFEWEKGWMEGDFAQSEELIVHTPYQDISYGLVNFDPLMPLQYILRAIRKDEGVPCGIRAAIPQVSCIEGLHTAIPQAVKAQSFDTSVRSDGQTFRQVPAWNEALCNCYRKSLAPFCLQKSGWAVGQVKINHKSVPHQWIKTETGS